MDYLNRLRNFLAPKPVAPIPQNQIVRPQPQPSFGDSLRSFATRQIGNVGGSLNNVFGDTNPTQAGRQNVITNYFNPESNGGQNFWNTNVARGLGRVQQVVNNPPRVNLQQYNQIQNPVGRTAAGLGLGVAENFVNIPQRLSVAGTRLGTAHREGRLNDPRTAIGTTAQIADPLLDIYTLGGASIVKGIGKQAFKQGGKQGFKTALKRGAVEGGGWGAIFGALNGLSEGDRASVLSGLQGAAVGAGAGVVLGGALGGVSGISGKMFNAIRKGIAKENPTLSPAEITKKALIRTGTYTRELATGRFAKDDTAQIVAGLKGNKLDRSKPLKINDWRDQVDKELGIDKIRDNFPQPGLSVKLVKSKKNVNPNTPVTHKELTTFYKNIQSVLEGKADKQIIAKDKNLISKLIQLDQGNDKYGLKHIRQHIKEGSITNQDVLRLSELLNTATDRAKIGSKVYYGKPENSNMKTLTAVVGDNPDIAKQINLLRLRNKQYQKTFGKPGGTLSNPSSNILSEVPGTGQRKFPGPQSTNTIIPPSVNIDKKINAKAGDPIETENFFKGRIKDTMEIRPMKADIVQPKLKVVNGKIKVNMEGVEAPKVSLKQQLKEAPEQARMSQKAIREGLEFPKSGRDISVSPQAQQRFKMQGNKEPLPWETNAQGAKVAGNNESIGNTSIGRLQLKPTKAIPDSQQTVNSLQPKQTVSTPRTQVKLSGGNTFDDIVDKSGLDVKKKVHIFNYLDTPEFVLEKVGLKSYADDLIKADDSYVKNLKTEINKVTEWAKQAPSKESSQRIFKWLDGDKSVKLDKTEAKIAGEIKTYLKDWADRIGLPEDKRIADYITHIFDKDLIQKEFDPDLAKIIDERISKSVYDPFLQKRQGAIGYKEDVFSALDAYVKRATRKEAFDPVLEQLSNRAQNLDLETYDYIKSYVSSINMQPTKFENLVDNWVKTIAGYKGGQRPTIAFTSSARSNIYRGALGLNVGSAIRNLSQWGNTYAKLGEKHTLLGYTKLFTKMAKRDLGELVDQNILGDNIVQDRRLSVTKQWLQKVDKGLFVFFDLAEKINRGSAYFGAKSKALSQGMNEQQAIDFAKRIVRETQFDYSRVGTPLALKDPVVKTLLQFMSYPIKQREFLQRMVTNKEYTGILRYVGASILTMATFGKLVGMRPTEFVPFSEIITGEGRFSTPSIQIGQGLLGMVSTDPDKRDEAKRNFWKNAALTVPAGVQIKKTYEGLQATGRGYGQSPSGRVRYPLPQDPLNRTRGALFGQYTFDEPKAYFKEARSGKRTPLGDKQSEIFKNLPPDQRNQFFNQIMDSREQKREVEGAKPIESGIFGLDIPNPFKKKDDTKQQLSDTVVWLDDNGKTQTVELNKKEKVKDGSFKSYKEESNNLSDAVKIYHANNDQVTREQKLAAYEKLGYSEDDIRYHARAKYLNSDEQAQYYADIYEDHDKLIEELVKGRVKSVGGEYMANNGALDKLYEMGKISHAERKYLKSLKLDKAGKPLAGSGGKGKGRKGRKVSINTSAFTRKIKPAKFTVIRRSGKKIINPPSPKKPEVKALKFKGRTMTLKKKN